MTRYVYRRERVDSGTEVEISDDAMAVNFAHDIPPNRSPAITTVEWLEPVED